MTKHRKCTRCNGSGKILVEDYDPHYRRGVAMIEKTCPTCHGKGYEEKENNSNDDVRVLNG